MQRLTLKSTFAALSGLTLLASCNSLQGDDGSGGDMASASASATATATTGGAMDGTMPTDGDPTATDTATDTATATDSMTGTDTNTGGTTGGDGTCSGIGVPTSIPDNLLMAVLEQFGKLNLSELTYLVALCNAIREGDPTAPGHSTGNAWAPSALAQVFIMGRFAVYLAATRTMPDAGDPELRAIDLDADDLDMAFPCGDNGDSLVLCVQDVPLPSGDYLVLGMVLEDDLVLDDTSHAYQYGFVFDADGDPSNNYMPSSSYPDDFFQETDRWYQALYEPATQSWFLEVVDWNGSVTVADSTSAARIVLAGNTMFAVVPADEIGGAADVNCPPYRMTAFAHTGDYGFNPPNYWAGDVEPLVTVGLDTICD